MRKGGGRVWIKKHCVREIGRRREGWRSEGGGKMKTDLKTKERALSTRMRSLKKQTFVKCSRGGLRKEEGRV